jgi:hypothetical protein
MAKHVQSSVVFFPEMGMIKWMLCACVAGLVACVVVLFLRVNALSKRSATGGGADVLSVAANTDFLPSSGTNWSLSNNGRIPLFSIPAPAQLLLGYGAVVQLQLSFGLKSAGVITGAFLELDDARFDAAVQLREDVYSVVALATFVIRPDAVNTSHSVDLLLQTPQPASGVTLVARPFEGVNSSYVVSYVRM